MIELPNGDRYHVHPGPADLEGYLAPEHVPHLEAGVIPIQVRVTRAGAGYSVNLAPDELDSLLRRARLEVLGQEEHPPEPARPRDPARGVGQRDPDAHRLGPNVAAAPDPGHRGTHRRRRKPSG
jgi:hypothetical protein